MAGNAIQQMAGGSSDPQPNPLQRAAVMGRSYFQGMNNAAAQMVCLPVDIIAGLLEQAGVSVGAAPTGGSEWAKRNKLTPEPENKAAGEYGEATVNALSALLPMKAGMLKGAK